MEDSDNEPTMVPGVVILPDGVNEVILTKSQQMQLLNKTRRRRFKISLWVILLLSLGFLGGGGYILYFLVNFGTLSIGPNTPYLSLGIGVVMLMMCSFGYSAIKKGETKKHYFCVYIFLGLILITVLGVTGLFAIISFFQLPGCTKHPSECKIDGSVEHGLKILWMNLRPDMKAQLKTTLSCGQWGNSSDPNEVAWLRSRKGEDTALDEFFGDRAVETAVDPYAELRRLVFPLSNGSIFWVTMDNKLRLPQLAHAFRASSMLGEVRPLLQGSTSALSNNTLTVQLYLELEIAGQILSTGTERLAQWRILSTTTPGATAPPLWWRTSNFTRDRLAEARFALNHSFVELTRSLPLLRRTSVAVTPFRFPALLHVNFTREEALQDASLEYELCKFPLAAVLRLNMLLIGCGLVLLAGLLALFGVAPVSIFLSSAHITDDSANANDGNDEDAAV